MEKRRNRAKRICDYMVIDRVHGGLVRQATYVCVGITNFV